VSADDIAADRITLRGLRVFGYHGVLEAERQDGQEFIVDAVLWLDTTAAAATDDLELTADYAALAGRLAAIVAGPPVQLIETLAQRLAEAATATEPRARQVEITVHKPHAPVGHRFDDVSVTIRRRPGDQAPGDKVPGDRPRGDRPGGRAPADPAPGDRPPGDRPGGRAPAGQPADRAG
jgi:dihydroneopterin aldolase